MKEQNEDQLESVFDDKLLGKTLKKAKRVTLIRTIIISATVCILIAFGLIKVNTMWINEIGNKTTAQLIQKDAIMKSPNTVIRTETIDTGLLKGTIKREVFKIVEDKIIPWETQNAHFGLKGFESMSFSSYRTIIDDNTHIQIPTGERSMMFFVPQYKYKSYTNDLLKLTEYPNDKYIELGISFDKNYTLDEVKKMLPKSVHPMWYWVNGYSKEYDDWAEPVSGKWMYGIYEPSSRVGKAMNSSEIKSESDFLNRLKKVYKNDYEELKKQQKDGLIIGVVVTGTKDALLELDDKPYVKASSLGAVVDKY
ncbi:anti sigma factor C-terminal domain-containing protein [Mesobacillus foraminis]|uniref:anti sigma factor C-terminal domain-containing protein n=1 Tax=Mesobacillus foraminis TaxID=279826 RepID=UPI000EF4FD3B|nr:anti sigma factor C-terminal domain-containing protein [Mesobacillus foraminis]